MSSMWRSVITLALLLAAAPSGSAQFVAPAPAYSAPTVASALETWRTLRQSDRYRFREYASFLIANPGWPDEARMRRWAEKALGPGENPATVIAFFGNHRPSSGSGWARLADAYSATGRAADALDAARHAWRSADLGSADEQSIWQRYGASFTRADDDDRLDALLFEKKPEDATRFLSGATPARQPAFAARLAMQEDTPDAEARYDAVISQVTSDAGLMMDRARYLKAHDHEELAQQLAAREHHFSYKPADPARFLDLLLQLTGDAVASRRWTTVYDIASGVDDVLPGGAQPGDQDLDYRDKYTSLVWYAGSAALDRLNRPRAAIAMFDRYAQGGKSLQVLTKGDYWAGRAALAAGQVQLANGYFQRAAAYPDLFYGQLALERLGRSVTPPPAALPQYVTTQAQRDAFNARRLVQAVKLLGEQGRSTEEALFIRALAESLDSDTDRNLAVLLGEQIGRQDIAVWTARMARVKGSSYYVRQAYPTLRSSVAGEIWSLAHGISRQESSFDPYAVSHAGALGMMQLMRGTARDQARKIGVGYDSSRLIGDPAYNVTLGSAYFQHLVEDWKGSVPLAVAAYNAGSGNVHKWVVHNGDPRGNVDVLKWIEAIPFVETRAYVQRVIENSVVYDSMRPGQPQQAALHVSHYLGKSRPG